MKLNLPNALILAPFIFSFFFLATRVIGCYLFNRKTNQPQIENNTMNTNKLKKLIDSVNGRFFSLEFQKLDGTIKKVNGKDFYRRLLSDGPKAGWNPLKGTSFTAFIDRNKEDWSSASDSRLIRFKCGAIEETF